MSCLFIRDLERSFQNETHPHTHTHKHLYPEKNTLYNLFSFNVSFKDEKKMFEALFLKI